MSIFADHVHPFMDTVHPCSDGCFEEDKAPCYKAQIISNLFLEHDREFTVLSNQISDQYYTFVMWRNRKFPSDKSTSVISCKYGPKSKKITKDSAFYTILCLIIWLYYHETVTELHISITQRQQTVHNRNQNQRKTKKASSTYWWKTFKLQLLDCCSMNGSVEVFFPHSSLQVPLKKQNIFDNDSCNWDIKKVQHVAFMLSSRS